MTSIFNKNLICGWCWKEFKTRITQNKNGEYEILQCPHCWRTLPSTKKESTKSFVNTKHIHREWKNGEVVI